MNREYEWVDWFKELAKKIASEDESFLIEKSKEIDWAGSRALLNFGDKNIDPFSFLYFLAGKNTEKQFEQVFDSVHDIFEMSGDKLNGLLTIPTPKAKFLFHDGKKFEPSILWRFFRQVVDDDQEINQQDFKNILNIKGVGIANFTQTLFLIDPTQYLPIDKKLLVLPSITDLPKLIKRISGSGYSEYENIIREIKEYFPECAPYEINLFLYLQSEENLIDNDSKFFQVSTNVLNDGVDMWESTEEYSETEHPTFKENSIVYVSDLTEKYPLKVPNKGYIVLVRFGINYGRGIGVILENEYREQLDKNSAIHVVWINKSSTEFTGQTTQMGFSEVRPNHETYKHFKNAKEYLPTFRLIDSFRETKPSRKIKLSREAKPQLSPYKGYSLNTILYGPPGTGKTYSTRQCCVEICESRARGDTKHDSAENLQTNYQKLVDDSRIKFITFHQTYGYEEFVEGLRPEPVSESGGEGGFRLKVQDGVLKRFADAARKRKSLRFVLVIDEINRANISKVLGELITILEEDKREGAEHELAVTLPFSRKKFTLPKNLHILGTMNTADRSIALLDTALRRRFDFVEILPDPECLTSVKEKTGVDLPKVLESINDRLEWLLDRDRLIGHGWFIRAESKEDVDLIMRNKVIPLVAEYFHDNWEKLQAVLGGTDDFVKKEELDPPPDMQEIFDEDRFRWRINSEFSNDAYKRLIARNQPK